MLNKNINSEKYDYATTMEIKKINIFFPNRPYSLRLQMVKLEEEKRC